MKINLGIDLGGTKTEIIALDPAGHTLLRERVTTRSQNYSELVEGTATLVESAEKKLGGSGFPLGIGTPGAVSSSGATKNSNTTCLNGKNLQMDLEQRLKRQVRIANDANCFTLSEAVDGAGADARLVFGVILGTGVGGGIVWDRKLWEGPNRIAGEWGHNPLPARQAQELPGPACYCGRHGCVETYLCGPGRVREPDRYVERLAAALGGVINILDPDVIVLGGGVSNTPGLVADVTAAWSRFIFSDDVRTHLRVAKHGDSSGVRGAAWLW